MINLQKLNKDEEKNKTKNISITNRCVVLQRLLPKLYVYQQKM